MDKSEDSPLLASNSRSNGPARRGDNWILRFRKEAHKSVEGTVDSFLEYTILWLIFANVGLLVSSTLKTNPKCFGSKCARYGDTYEGFFETAELISVLIFTVEYVLRIWSCVEFPDIAALGPWKGRLSYATRFFPVVDFLSIAPWWIGLLLGSEAPDFVTALRAFRLIRLLKADKYIQAFGLLGTVLYENGTLLIATSFYAFLTWIFFATAMYYTEVDNPALGNHFQSILSSLFPTLLMLTGEFPLEAFVSYNIVPICHRNAGT